MVPAAGLEPARALGPTDFKSVMSTIPSRRRLYLAYIAIILLKMQVLVVAYQETFYRCGKFFF